MAHVPVWSLGPQHHGDFVSGKAVGLCWYPDGWESSLFHPVVAHTSTAPSFTVKPEGEAAVCRPCAGRISQSEASLSLSRRV